MAINQLSGIAFGLLIILANDLDPFCDVPILVYDEGIIAVICAPMMVQFGAYNSGRADESRPSKPRSCPLPDPCVGGRRFHFCRWVRKFSFAIL